MLNLLSPLISSFDHFSEELLNCILSQIMEPLKSTKKDACNLAKNLILTCSDSLECHLRSVSKLQGNEMHDANDNRTLTFSSFEWHLETLLTKARKNC